MCRLDQHSVSQISVQALPLSPLGFGCQNPNPVLNLRQVAAVPHYDGEADVPVGKFPIQRLYPVSCRRVHH